MNTNHLKKFAQEARRKLIDQVASRLNYVLNTDSAELREKSAAISNLREALKNVTKEQLIDKVAYTWFNRLVALRFMDVNDYQPIGVRVVSTLEGFTTPEILDEAKRGHIHDEIQVDIRKIGDLLDGRIPSSNAQNEVYKLLLTGVCNHLHKTFPFLFERIDDYTELLLPDDLTSEFSIIQDIRNGMSKEDCEEVEIIGWLYQFYISERKDELINAKKRYKADEIAPVTQLFTPKWIVQYMVDNTLGQLWKEARPNTSITGGLEFYIKPNNPELIPLRDLKSIEDITFFDPCVGSAHVLCYAYDIFYKMYEEEGYNTSDIPELIITKNLFGIDIDDRAAQLASFALMMKGRKNQRRFFRKNIAPNITTFKNIESHPKFENAEVLGSLIKVSKQEVDDIIIDETSLFAEREIHLKKQATLLANKYDIVVTNPPYLNSSYMEDDLKQFVDKEYKTTKSDLFACFLVQVSNMTKKEGLIGFICPYVWMFLNSYKWLREFTIETTTISSLIQLEYNAFGPAVVPIGTFTLRNRLIKHYNGSYIKLSDFKGVENQKPKTLEAIKNPDCGWFFTTNQNVFNNIPGNPIGYWVSKKIFQLFKENERMETLIPSYQGMATTDNSHFMRNWCELKSDSIGLGLNRKEALESKKKWFPYNKGGAFRKWYGNQIFLVDWGNDGRNIKESATKKYPYLKGNISYVIKENNPYYSPSISWTDLTTRGLTARYYPIGFLFDVSGHSAIFNDNKIQLGLLGYLNSKIADGLSKLLNPSMHFQVGDFRKLPYLKEIIENHSFQDIVSKNMQISADEWNSRETSWDFNQNELIRINSQDAPTGNSTDLEEAYDLYENYWANKFFHLHKNEEELNKKIIEVYDLQKELNSDVPLKDITILKEETSIMNGKLVFDQNEVFAQFVSYAVGCMFGRYSIDKEGLILANQGETLQDYLLKVEKQELELSFVPDDDNIIPVLDDEWFEDDIVGRFYAFLKASFGEQNFEKNLSFIEDSLGKDIRKYFVKDFYKDHIKRYKKRPIYWMFSSPKGSFNVLVYMHRYTPDTLNQVLNGYLNEYREKLKTRIETLDHLMVSGSPSEQNKASKEKDKIQLVLLELQEYERETLYPLATERISIDLDDGVLVNYNKFGDAIAAVAGLNDKKAKEKVKKFDWIDTTTIR
ncbi:BREX-1 system adenine-specific DNA-methyltransferase PglX [Flavobacteriaceae bacterium]|nr:BREX-1 system adenine-specific DNA-methyltransferase PglX [Flavobacteriaceae bacterium]